VNVFTSAAANYLPKARVLAATVRRFHPEARVHLVLADRRPAPGAAGLELFDSVLTLDDLPLGNVRAWAFRHTVVELCTAVKGVAARVLLDRHGGPLVFFDPDVAVLAPLDELGPRLVRHPILITPHLTEPEASPGAIVANEIAALRHGVFNMGFFVLAPAPATDRFLDWWSERLLRHCYAEPNRGLFTDQRWMDLALAFFPEIGVLREPWFHLAPWNVSRRRVAGRAPFGLTVEGHPVVFFHFSGFDRGALEDMVDRFARLGSPVRDLVAWYGAECERHRGAADRAPWLYGAFDDGTPVTTAQRVAYRREPRLQAAYPDPYATADPARSYLAWCRRNLSAAADGRPLAEQLDDARRALLELETSRAWRLFQRLARARRRLRSTWRGALHRAFRAAGRGAGSTRPGVPPPGGATPVPGRGPAAGGRGSAAPPPD
jgi:hypothetical protein